MLRPFQKNILEYIGIKNRNMINNVNIIIMCICYWLFRIMYVVFKFNIYLNKFLNFFLQSINLEIILYVSMY